MPWEVNRSEGLEEERVLRRSEFIKNMHEDIQHEYRHMHTYLHAAIIVQGLHREELSEFFLKEAASEMKHVEEFGRMFLGVFDKHPPGPNAYHATSLSANPVPLLDEILQMENQVVVRYARRMKEAEELGGPDGSVLHVFYENQILDSQNTVNHVKQMLKGIPGAN